MPCGGSKGIQGLEWQQRSSHRLPAHLSCYRCKGKHQAVRPPAPVHSEMEHSRAVGGMEAGAGSRKPALGVVAIINLARAALQLGMLLPSAQQLMLFILVHPTKFTLVHLRIPKVLCPKRKGREHGTSGFQWQGRASLVDHNGQVDSWGGRNSPSNNPVPSHSRY